MIGDGHWLYIIVLALIVMIIFGPGRLPEVGAALGKALREFKSHVVRGDDERQTSHGLPGRGGGGA